jgi:hypothetical protein
MEKGIDRLQYDSGGSVTMPSAFAGLYSLKPSHGRISYKDVANSVCFPPRFSLTIFWVATDSDLGSGPANHPLNHRHHGNITAFLTAYVQIIAIDKALA